MKLATPLVALFLATQSAASFFGQRIEVDNSLSVPGDNPLQYCQAADDNILAIEYVNLSPNPPVPGKELKIQAVGTFSEKVEKGAKVFLSVKYGLIRIVNTEQDLCDQMEKIGKPCPLGPGQELITKSVDIPEKIPPGMYTVVADVFTEDKRKITCLQASVEFGKNDKQEQAELK